MCIGLPDGYDMPLPEAIGQLIQERDEKSVTVRFDPAEIEAGHILQQLQSAGLRIGDVQTTQPDLEDIFIELVEQNQS